MSALDPTLMAFVMFVGGYVLSRWDRRGDRQETLGLDATALGVRLKAAEDWIDRHSDIGADFAGLSKQMESMARAVEKLADRVNEWLDAPASPPRGRRAN